MKKSYLAVAVILLLTTGCVEEQLTIDTNTVIPTLANIQRNQIGDNLVRFAINPNAFPVQANISGGSVQVAGQIQPSFAFPFHGWMGNQASLQLQGQVTENWALQPINDASDLMRLRALYRYATTSLSFEAFTNEYLQILVMATQTASDRTGPTQKMVGAQPPNYYLPQLNPSFTTNGLAKPSDFFITNDFTCPNDFVSLVKDDTKYKYFVGCFLGHNLWAKDTNSFDKFTIYIASATYNTVSGGGAGGGGGKAGQAGQAGQPGQVLLSPQ